jgi:nicotinamide mononucleotide adenylyltransferase
MPVVSETVHREEAIREEAKAAEAPVEEFGVGAQDKGRYVYGIAVGKEAVKLGKIGIENNEVYTIPYQNLCAIVHNCPPEPYQSQDDETVKRWVRAHQDVLDEAKKVLGTIIPLGFDTILQPKDDATSPDQMVRDWLKEDYDRLSALMEKIKDKDEYGVQVSYEPKVMSELIAQQSEEVKKIKEEMATKSSGMAYMYKQKLEKAVKAEMERLADEWFKNFYSNIKKHTEDIVVEKTKKLEKDKVMLLNLSCLVSKEKVEGLGEELEKIDNMEGFSVRFTGPWPPYSFVAKPVTEGE